MPDPVMTTEQQQAYNKAFKKIDACRRNGGIALDLSELGLTRLPPEIGQLTALTQLRLYNNQLSSLPPELGQLTALTQLVLISNQLSSLPPEIGQLTALTWLYLGNNQLSSLPDWLNPSLSLFRRLRPLALGKPAWILGRVEKVKCCAIIICNRWL